MAPSPLRGKGLGWCFESNNPYIFSHPVNYVYKSPFPSEPIQNNLIAAEFFNGVVARIHHENFTRGIHGNRSGVVEKTRCFTVEPEGG